jgi:hypothetical protein
MHGKSPSCAAPTHIGRVQQVVRCSQLGRRPARATSMASSTSDLAGGAGRRGARSNDVPRYGKYTGLGPAAKLDCTCVALSATL